MERVDTSPDQMLAELAEDVRDDMEALDRIISEAMPGRTRELWEGVFWGGTEQRIIGYGEIVQPRPRGETVEWFAVGLARQKDHASVYVNAVDDGAYLLRNYADRLGKVKTGSASIAIRRLDDLDVDVFTEMVERVHRLLD